MSNKFDWIKENFPLKAHNTFGIAANARFFCEITQVEQLQTLLTTPFYQALPKLILGEGSNILLTQDFPGIIIKIKIKGLTCTEEDDDQVLVEAGGGGNWHDLVMYCLQHNYAGVENLSLIPGTVGAAPMQNIGAYGVELTQVFHCLKAINRRDGSIKEFAHSDCCFGYRDSVFKNQLKDQYIIFSVTLKLRKKPVFHLEYGELRQLISNVPMGELNIQAISQAVIQLRTQKLPDPKIIGNAGSFFKNPIISSEKFMTMESSLGKIPHYPSVTGVKIPAGWLIEQCRWKGHRKGAVGVHEKHALVLVNYGSGTGQQIHQLAQEIQQSVLDRFGIQLLPEVNII